MLTKILYIIIDSIGIIIILFTIRAIMGIKAEYGKWLKYTLGASILAIASNILIACSADPMLAEIAYCFYFSSINWIIYCLTGFCLLYTEHRTEFNILRIPGGCIMAADALSIFANLLLHHHFTIYEKTVGGVVFYQTAFRPVYYIHLTIDYIYIIVALLFIISRIVNSYDLYRMKYVIILSVLLFVIALNIAYMALSLVLDASVVFYAVAGMLIYFCTEIFVPRKLMNSSVSRAVDDMNEGLIIFDISNNCIYTNAFCEYRFGITASTCDITRDPIASVLKDLEASGRNFGETSYIDRSGAEVAHYKIKYTSLLDRRARSIGSYFLLQDTTEEVHYMEEIQRSRIAADKANEAKSTFLANMSHEIRTPLNAILGMNEMIIRTTQNPEIAEYADNIQDSGKTLLSLINDILDFSKIEAGRMEVTESEYEPLQLIRDCYYFFEQTAGVKDLYLHFNFDEKIPMKLYGDPLHIRQILTNIISNAIKYTKEGGVTVNVFYNNTGSNRIELITEVSDTGMGIEKEDIPHLFESFKRVNESENAAIQGTGLGLSITKQLVELMNGRITVDSAPGEGSSFKVMIPQTVTDHTDSGKLILLHKKEEAVYKESFHAPDAKILIVDDVKLNLKVACALLRKTRIKTETALSGDAAIQMCMTTKYDAILLDHRMPIKDGIETFGEISSKGMNTDTPVIMLTANAVNGIEEEYKKIGFAGYLSKPIDISSLENMLKDILPIAKVLP
ncbi:MAG: response regulator [Lachnospiraceae bacterium]|nr:response regulator [Lachnospiraceae bacterium]